MVIEKKKILLLKKQKLLILFGVVITIVTILFQIINDSILSNPLSYHRDTFLSQIYWQLITPSLVHANWNHWFLNITNLYAIIFLCYEAWNIKKILGLFLFSPITQNTLKLIRFKIFLIPILRYLTL